MEPEPDYVSAKQAAELLKLSDRRVRVLAEQGRLPGAFVVGKTWVIPTQSVAEFVPNPHGVRLGRKPRKKAEGTGG